MDQSTATLEDLTPVRKRLEVEVPAAAVQAELDRTFHEVGRRARLRGFRPGKAPRPVLERAFGEEVRREVLGRLVEASFHRAVETHGLAVVGTPDIDAEPITPGAALRYSATVEVRPAIALGDLGGLQVVRPATRVSDADVEQTIGGLRESVAQLRPVEDRARVEAGDVVLVDLTSRLEGGEPVRREGVLLEAGSGSFPLALERQLVGQSRGARLALRVPYPADHPNTGLAGKTAEFEVEVKELRVKELPPLDDDFARDHGKCESLAALRARVRADLEQEAATRADAAVREALIDQLLARHTFDVPSTLVERRTEALLQTLDLRLPEGAEREQALARLREQLRPRAERQVRTELLLDALAARDGIAVNDDELHAEVDGIAARERQVVERVRAFYERPEARAALRAKLVRDRALAGVLAAARVMPSSPAESVAHENQTRYNPR
ncbi:MAG: trigger factor [Deltaproteobacteria bacterium]|nr:MAG: trigger factor [Deltaproteobacteria bacterium]